MRNEGATEAVQDVVGPAGMVSPQILSLGKMVSTVTFTTRQKVENTQHTHTQPYNHRSHINEGWNKEWSITLGSPCPEDNGFSEALWGA